MGRSVAKAALSHGDKVVAIGRTFETSLPSMQNWHVPTATAPAEHFLGLVCDVRVHETVRAAIKASLRHFGHIDIIANCSGYGVIGACEDQDEYEIRNQFETNFMGTLNMIQLSLPYLRERGSGRYLIFSSISGALGVPGLGPYCATKYAVEGLIESMLYEVDTFNVRATLISPGYIRRDEPVQSTDSRLPAFGHFLVKPASEPYSGNTAPAAHARRMLHWLGDNQPTSAVKSAELIWQLGHCSFPPLRLLLGSYAVDSIRDRLRSVIEEIEDWKHLSFPSIDQEEPAAGDGKDQEQEEKANLDSGDGEKDEDEKADEEMGAGQDPDEAQPTSP